MCYTVFQNDRMFNKQTIIAAKLDREAANWLQTFNCLNSKDAWLQFYIEKAKRETFETLSGRM